MRDANISAEDRIIGSDRCRRFIRTHGQRRLLAPMSKNVQRAGSDILGRRDEMFWYRDSTISRQLPDRASATVVFAAIVGFFIFDAASQAQEDTQGNENNVSTNAIVIELTVESRDTIELQRSELRSEELNPIIVFEEGALLIHPAVVRAMHREQPDFSLKVEDGVEELSDPAVIVVERRSYVSDVREGDQTLLWLYRRLPEFPVPEQPETVLITPVGAAPPLRDIIVWPDVAWRLDGINGDAPRLIVESVSGRHELSPGDQVAFDENQWVLPVRFGRFAPVPVGEVPAELTPVEYLLGDTIFATRIAIKFLGELEVRELE